MSALIADPSEAAADALGFVELDGGGLLRLSKVNGIVMPDDMPGRLETPILIIGVLNIPIAYETAKEAKTRLLVCQPSAPSAEDNGERRIVRMSAEEWAAKNRHIQALEEAVVMVNEVAERCKAECAAQDRRLLWMQEKLMQIDGANAGELGTPEARLNLKETIDAAMEAEGATA